MSSLAYARGERAAYRTAKHRCLGHRSRVHAASNISTCDKIITTNSSHGSGALSPRRNTVTVTASEHLPLPHSTYPSVYHCTMLIVVRCNNIEHYIQNPTNKKNDREHTNQRRVVVDPTGSFEKLQAAFKPFVYTRNQHRAATPTIIGPDSWKSAEKPYLVCMYAQ